MNEHCETSGMYLPAAAWLQASSSVRGLGLRWRFRLANCLAYEQYAGTEPGLGLTRTCMPFLAKPMGNSLWHGEPYCWQFMNELLPMPSWWRFFVNPKRLLEFLLAWKMVFKNAKTIIYSQYLAERFGLMAVLLIHNVLFWHVSSFPIEEIVLNGSL